jgi:hypothetical protein
MRFRPVLCVLQLVVVSLSGLYDVVLVLRSQMNLVVGGRSSIAVGCVAEAVLIAQLLINLGINLVDRLFLRDRTCVHRFL